MATHQVTGSTADASQPGLEASNVMLNSRYPAMQLAAAMTAVERANEVEASKSPYVRGQTQEHKASAQRAAARRVRQWSDVIHGVATGAIETGSRQPVLKFPVWVTLEVAKGGFATSRALAGAVLRPDELELAQREGIEDHSDRSGLAAYYMSDKGLEHLWKTLESGGYKIEVPEHAAFLVIAWLLAQRQDSAMAAAVTLLDTLTPLLATLQFSPPPAPACDIPAVSDSNASTPCIIDTLPVHRFTAQRAQQALKENPSNQKMEQQREAATVWAPFYDSVLALWLEAGAGGDEFIQSEPVLPIEWLQQAGMLVARCQVLKAKHNLCKRHLQPEKNTAVLRSALEHIVSQGGVLSAGARRQVSYRVACMLQKRGDPAGPKTREIREKQAASVRKPLHAQLALVLCNRIAAMDLPDRDTNRGIPLHQIEALLMPTTTSEASLPVSCDQHIQWNVPEGSTFPQKLRTLVNSSMEAPLATLVDKKVIPSEEVFAKVAEGLTAAARSAQYESPVLARLMAALEAAFLRRRSLLLLQLQMQVRVSEIPWHAAVKDRYANPNHARKVCADLMLQLAGTAMHSFPGVLLPNKLVRQLAALAQVSNAPAARSTTEGFEFVQGSGFEEDSEMECVTEPPLKTAICVPCSESNMHESPLQPMEDFVLLEELAADIFECKFSAKFAVAARQAARTMQGTVYERYYGLDYSEIAKRVPQSDSRGPSAEFFDLCEELCGLRVASSVGGHRCGTAGDLMHGGGPKKSYMYYYGYSTQNNRKIIEQAQIVTTHNLAMLVEAGVTARAVEGDGSGWGGLARRCAREVCKLTGTARAARGYSARMQWARQAACAWRHMVFFLSFEESGEERGVVVEELQQGGTEVSWVLQPKLLRLREAMAASVHESPECATRSTLHGEPLVGWRAGGLLLECA